MARGVRVVAADGRSKVRADRTLGPALVAAFERAKDDDPQVRRYLALAIGRLDPPLPAKAVDVLGKALNDPDSERASARSGRSGRRAMPASFLVFNLCMNHPMPASAR